MIEKIEVTAITSSVHAKKKAPGDAAVFGLTAPALFVM
jgi:hypothetical protein